MVIRIALHWKILFGLIIGATAGILASRWCPPEKDGSPNAELAWTAQNVAKPIGQVFLRVIFMVVVPLVFAALSLAIVEIGDVRRLGRMGLRTLLFTFVLSSLSVAIGLTLANTVRPGARLAVDKREELLKRFSSQVEEPEAQARRAKSLPETLLDIIPENPLQEMVGALDGSSPGGGMLAVMFFALVIGVAITLSPQRTGPLVFVLEGTYDVVMVIIGWAMRLAPLAVAALTFALTSVLGMDILKTLVWYVLTVLAGLALQLLGVYSLVIALFTRFRPREFFTRISDAMLTAFGTSSSNATLPTSLKVAQENLGLRPEVSRFVLTVGSTANQNGTALYEGITVLFLAQVFGKDLSFAQQLQVVLMSVLAGVGTAGVPGGSLPLIAILLNRLQIPAEGLAIILGVDRLLDMCRTTLNVTGDIAIAACVDRAEGNWDAHSRRARLQMTNDEIPNDERMTNDQ